jgi:hypothetical protein
MPELADVLDLSLFGVGAAKTFAELEAEIQSGECEICWEDDRPIRLIQIVNVHVRSHTGQRLLEDRQEFTDGRVRRRGLVGLAEKLQIGETPAAAAKRALAEELGIEAALEIVPIAEETGERFSDSYPGLLNRHHTHIFQVTLPENLYRSFYVEVQPTKKTFFVWA